MKSSKPVKSLSEVVKPLKVVFPVDVEGFVNNVGYKIKRNTPTEIDYPTYEAINHSLYAKYIA